MNASDNFSAEANLDENWLRELAVVVNSFIKGESLREDSLSPEVNECLVTILGNFKDDKLNLASLHFDDDEVEQCVHSMPKLTKKGLKAAKKELEMRLLEVKGK